MNYDNMENKRILDLIMQLGVNIPDSYKWDYELRKEFDEVTTFLKKNSTLYPKETREWKSKEEFFKE